MRNDINWNYDEPLDQMPGETNKANVALRDYWLMGAGRSLSKLADKYRTEPESAPTKRLSTLKKWSVDFCWQVRIARFEEIKFLKETAEEEAKWAERRERLREEGWQAYEKLIQKVSEMLRFPIATVKREDDNTIILPADWKLRDVARLLEVADKVGRMASELGVVRGEEEGGGEDIEEEDIEEIRQKRWEQVSPELAKLIERAMEDKPSEDSNA